MNKEEAKNFIIDISYELGNMAVEYLTEKDGEKMREAVEVLEQGETVTDFADKCRECGARNGKMLNDMWINVSEKRLPKENETVIASTDYCIYPEARYTEKYGWEGAYESGADYWVKLKDVIAWMPLPKHYEPQE